MTRKGIVGIALVLVVVAGLGLLILKRDLSLSFPGVKAESSATPADGRDAPKGPHGGRLLSEGNLQLEITIYEGGVPPQFRVYAFEGGRPIDPKEVRLTIELHRLGGRIDVINFRPEGDYLRGDRTVEEPHSFNVTVIAERKEQTFRVEYAQIEGRVELPPEALTSAGVEFATAGPARVRQTVDLPGEVGLNTDRMARVVPRLSGTLTEVRPTLGSRVHAGEVLAVIDSREMAEAKREFVEAAHRATFARTAFEREEMLWRKKISAQEEYLLKQQAFEEARMARQTARQKLRILGVPDTEVERLEEAGGERAGRFEIRAPLAGMVIEKQVTLGETVKGDQVIFVIADLSTVWVDVLVAPRDLGLVRVGQKVLVRSDALTVEVPGVLTYLGPLVGEETRAAKGRVVVDNRDGRWRPGLFATVRLVHQEATVPVAVKVDAIHTWREMPVVFAQFDRVLEVRPLKLGRRDGEWVEVLAGLAAGQRYASAGSFVLKAELEKAAATHDH